MDGYLYVFISLSIIGAFSADSCDLGVRLHKELHNEGFHRNLTYKLTMRVSYQDCYVGIDQVLPAGLYAAPDELGDLKRMNKLTAIPKNRVNIELPAEESNPTSVFIIGQLTDGEVNLWLPVHARYHRAAKGGGFYHNDIEQPRVFLRCEHGQLDNCESHLSHITFPCRGVGKDNCVWKEIAVTAVTSQPLRFSVPIGDLDHNDIVAPATGLIVVSLSLYLLRTLHQYKMAVVKRTVRSLKKS